MQSHNLKRLHKNKKTRQIGRAGGRGKTSGRGTKGQNARAGHKKRPEIRDFIKRIPKLRGRGKNINQSIQKDFVAVNIGALNTYFKTGDIVSPETLIKMSLIKTVSGVSPKVKILATGTLEHKLTIQGCAVSTPARTAIEKVGGTIVL